MKHSPSFLVYSMRFTANRKTVYWALVCRSLGSCFSLCYTSNLIPCVQTHFHRFPSIYRISNPYNVLYGWFEELPHKRHMQIYLECLSIPFLKKIFSVLSQFFPWTIHISFNKRDYFFFLLNLVKKHVKRFDCFFRNNSLAFVG